MLSGSHLMNLEVCSCEKLHQLSQSNSYKAASMNIACGEKKNLEHHCSNFTPNRDIDKSRTTGKRPKPNRRVERLYYVLDVMLIMYYESKRNSWDEILHVILQYNTSV
ncbi:hypothetical protein CHS0354_017491 [Potamilus streckersoni]|uniref:Uncharacterized protein n=1 Tax=Potamilus streckersoni TaxID=2493646 RepID=A0AAE0W428_9BIVA|nr:hypothetical protein CHS0354_017491 [Potamilus streckersoni]